jgi:hypothetical protein
MNDFLLEYFTKDEIFFNLFLQRDAETKKVIKQKHFSNNLWKAEHHYKTWLSWNSQNVDIYFSINSFTSNSDGEIKRTKPFVSKIKSLFFDCDKDGDIAKDNIISELGEPTWLIQTSEHNWQLLYEYEDADIKDWKHIENVSRTLNIHFKTDVGTYDISRVGRLPFLVNNKNGHQVVLKKTDKTYKVVHFSNYLTKNNIDLCEMGASATTTRKTGEKKVIDHSSLPTIKPTASYQKKYKEYLSRCDIKSDGSPDASNADFSFLLYLIKVKKLKNDKTLFKHFISNCDDVLTRHYDIEHYFQISLENARKK